MCRCVCHVQDQISGWPGKGVGVLEKVRKKVKVRPLGAWGQGGGRGHAVETSCWRDCLREGEGLCREHEGKEQPESET